MAEVTAEEIDTALRGFLPLMSFGEVTVRVLVDKLAEVFQADRSEFSAQWKKLIKQKGMELVVLCHDYKEEAEEEEEEPASAVEESGEEEEELPRARGRSARATPLPKRSRIMVSDESDEGESDEEAEFETGQEGSDSEEAPAKRRKTSKTTEVKRSTPKASSSKTTSTAAKTKTKTPKSQDPAGLAALKELGRAAGALNPRVYKALKGASSTDEAEEILRERLAEAGIRFTGPYPSSRDVAAAKKKRARDKELEDIDTSLIITDDIRPRRSSAHAVSYAPPPVVEAGDDVVGGFGKEEEDEEEAQDEPDESEASGSESEEGSEAEF